MRFTRLPVAILATALVVTLAAPASAQVFGKNKVQYEPLEWSVLESPHMNLHYYAEEESLARHLSVFSESVCVEFDRRFNLKFRRPIPFLLYSVHHLFQQTNASPGFISEGTGGLTELIKGRVMLPHTGSWARLAWVTRHELTHAYMLEKLARVQKDHKKNQNYLPPLWFIEGLAEFCGTTWDADAEGLLRDAVISGEAVPLTESDRILGTVLMYKEGQSFLLYLAEKYGEQKIFDILENWYRSDDFETTFRITVGVPLKKVDEEWFASLRRRYYPVVHATQEPAEMGRRLTMRGWYNLGPRALPGSSDSTVRFCYFAASEGGVDFMINEPVAGRRGKRRDVRVLRSGTSPQFESFHLFQNRADVSPSGLIALSSKHGGRDALFLVDAAQKRVVKRFDFPRLVAINDPSLVPGDTAAVFSAQDYSGRSDLYRATWKAKTVRIERLTNDDYDDLEPDVSPDGRWLVFSSDRCDRKGNYSLFRLPLAGGPIEAVSEPDSGDDRQPVYSPDGKWIAFRSTRKGTSDLYVRPAEPALEARRVTRLIGPALDPDWLPSGKGLLFTAQHEIRFQTYHVAFDPDTLVAEVEQPSERAPVLPLVYTEEEGQRYQRRLSLDLAQNGVAIDPAMSSAGGAGQVALSDVLGNEQIYLFLSNDSERFGKFWDGFEGGLTYINRSRRLNWGVGAFRLTQVYDPELNVIRREPRVGLTGLASYPFNKFTRIEGSFTVRHANDHRLQNHQVMDVDLVSNFLALVHDNSRWSYLGPSGGLRLYASAGFTRDLSSGAGDYGTVLGEVRHYAMPVPIIVSATRVQFQASMGNDAQSYSLGGWGSLRGFDRRALVGNRTVLAQQELRFPLMRGLTFAIPAPWAFPPVNGAVFADAGMTWDDFGSQSLGSAGAGVFFGGGYFPAFRWNFVWPTHDFKSFSKRPRTQFSIGYNF
jgi:hypothetical protein